MFVKRYVPNGNKVWKGYFWHKGHSQGHMAEEVNQWRWVKDVIPNFPIASMYQKDMILKIHFHIAFHFYSEKKVKIKMPTGSYRP